MNKNKTYIINMDKDTHRLSKVTAECDKMNIKFDRFVGCDVNLLSDIEKNKYITKLCSLFCSNSIIGCGISHIKIYEEIIKHKYNNTLILEDDIYFKDNFHNVLNEALLELPHDYDILYLGSFGLSNIKPYYDYNNIFKIFNLLKNRNIKEYKTIHVPEFALGNHGYIISYEGCKKILNIIKKLNYHIDFTIAYNNDKLNIYSVKEKIVFQKNEDSNNAELIGFPKIFNYYLNNIYDQNNIPYSYVFNVTLFKLYHININIWIILFFIFGLTNNKYINIYIIIYILKDYNKNFLVIYLLGLIINKIIKKKL